MTRKSRCADFYADTNKKPESTIAPTERGCLLVSQPPFVNLLFGLMCANVRVCVERREPARVFCTMRAGCCATELPGPALLAIMQKMRYS